MPVRIGKDEAVKRAWAKLQRDHRARRYVEAPCHVRLGWLWCRVQFNEELPESGIRTAPGCAILVVNRLTRGVTWVPVK